MSMPNYLKMPKKSQVLALLELGWSYRRIEAETGVRRETVSGYDAARQANAAKTFPGSGPSPPPDSPDLSRDEGPNPAKSFPGSPARRRFAAVGYRTAITEKLDAGLSLQRIWQDLVEEYGYGASYESVKRFVRTIAPTRRAVGVFHCAPGAEAQVDFFRGVPTLDGATGEWRRPWGFRMTLGHSRHGYEEAVWDQKLEMFLRIHERAFRDVGSWPAWCVMTISKPPWSVRASTIATATTSISRSRRTGGSRRSRRSRAARRKTGSRSAVAATSKAIR
jgi:hypothetical protein